jgi:uncharacterized membrane protein YeaQ/YmgE (transglycosylase-associated protein family)
MVNFLVWIIVGALIGWVASSLMGRREGLLLNIIVGIAGAFIGGLLLTPYFGITTINQNNFSLPALMVSLLGAVVLMAVVNLLSRRRAFR